MQQRATYTGPTPPKTSGAPDRVIDSYRFSFTEPRLPTVDNRSSSIFRLQRTDIEPFNGDPKKWKDWQSMFRDAVHNNATLTTTEKITALRLCIARNIDDSLGSCLNNQALYFFLSTLCIECCQHKNKKHV